MTQIIHIWMRLRSLSSYIGNNHHKSSKIGWFLNQHTKTSTFGWNREVKKSSIFGIQTYLTQSGHFHIVKYLIDEQGCNPSCLDEYKYTPLHCAAMSGHIDIVKFLTVEKDCDPMCKDFNQNTPLHMAAGKGHLEIAHSWRVHSHHWTHEQPQQQMEQYSSS